MPPTEDKRKAARETIDVLYEISSLLVRFSLSHLQLPTRRTNDASTLFPHSHLPSVTILIVAKIHRTRI
jgi:hypothetical protein